MEYFDVVEKRRSYRDAFADEPVKAEDLRKILENAILAPSGYNLQSTKFVAVTDPTEIAQIAEVLPSDATKTAKAIIVLVTEHIEADGLCFEVEDYGIALAHLMLGVTALGYATVCMDGDVQEEDHQSQIAAIINAPEDVTVRAILPIGVPTKNQGLATRKSYEERVIDNRF